MIISKAGCREIFYFHSLETNNLLYTIQTLIKIHRVQCTEPILLSVGSF